MTQTACVGEIGFAVLRFVKRGRAVKEHFAEYSFYFVYAELFLPATYQRVVFQLQCGESEVCNFTLRIFQSVLDSKYS